MNRKYELLTKQEIYARFKRPGEGGWVELSAVGFNRTRTVAVLWVRHGCPGLCGSGQSTYCTKKTGNGSRWSGKGRAAQFRHEIVVDKSFEIMSGNGCRERIRAMKLYGPLYLQIVDGLALLIFFVVNPLLFIAIGYGAWKGKPSGFNQKKYVTWAVTRSSLAPFLFFLRSGLMLILGLGRLPSKHRA